MHLIATLHQSLVETKTQKWDVGTDVTTVFRIALSKRLQTPKFSGICVQCKRKTKKKEQKADLVGQYWTKFVTSHSGPRTFR